MRGATSDKLCGCGCGEFTKLNDDGSPRQFRHGHHLRLIDRNGIYRVGHVVLDNGCWLWQGAISAEGYGEIWRPNRTKAHRWYYEQEHGPIPPGAHVHHRCHERRCVNPEHLEVVTPRTHRQIHPMPTGPFRVKLDSSKVREIRARVAAGEQQLALAREFGVSHSTIHQVVFRLTWRNVD